MAAAAVYYKFKSSAKDWETVAFDNASISVLDFKRSVVRQKHLDKSKDDFDLLVTNSQTGEYYRDNGYLIPKNTSLIVRRVRATTERSVVIKAAPEIETSASAPAEQTAESSRMMDVVRQSQGAGYNDSAGLFGQQGKFGRNAPHPGAPPPAGYVCHRCNTPGHYINFCPTNQDPHFDHKKQLPATGIPRDFLPDSSAQLDEAHMLSIPNERAFRGVPNRNAPVRSGPSKELTCSICMKTLMKATTTPCCYCTFCDECIRQSLAASEHAECPVCKQTDVNSEDLIPNARLRDITGSMPREVVAPPSRERRDVPRSRDRAPPSRDRRSPDRYRRRDDRRRGDHRRRRSRSRSRERRYRR